MATLTAEQGYAAMFHFLDNFYFRTKSDDVGSLLGSMSLLADGDPVDRALVGDWQEAVRVALDESTSSPESATQPVRVEKEMMTEKQAYAAMYCFLDRHFRAIESDEGAALLRDMSPLDGEPVDPAIAGNWVESLEFVHAGGKAGNLEPTPPDKPS